jgi:hypothetical protein
MYPTKNRKNRKQWGQTDSEKRGDADMASLDDAAANARP